MRRDLESNQRTHEQTIKNNTLKGIKLPCEIAQVCSSADCDLDSLAGVEEGARGLIKGPYSRVWALKSWEKEELVNRKTTKNGDCAGGIFPDPFTQSPLKTSTSLTHPRV